MNEEGSKKTIITEIGYAEEFQDFIVLNQDVCVEDNLKTLIMNTQKGELLQVVKEIGSTPIIIKSVDKYDEDFLLKNF
ncbi:MAG: hypothetical protein AABX82_07075 [Nanoarchaeota archaeon]